MLRLTGLPAVARYPHASVRGGEGRIEVVFAGPVGRRTVDIPLRYLGGEPDHEETALRLLARLKGLGYEVDWQSRQEPHPARAGSG